MWDQLFLEFYSELFVYDRNVKFRRKEDAAFPSLLYSSVMIAPKVLVLLLKLYLCKVLKFYEL